MSALEIASEVSLLTLAYALASVPFGVLITRWVANVDVRTIGSGSGGSTNVFRAAGLRWFIAVAALDVAKGALIMVGAMFLIDNAYILGLVAAAVIAGHSWPVWANFKGGKGSLVGISALIALYNPYWWALAIILGAASLSFAVTRTTSLVSLLGGISVLIFAIAVSVNGAQPGAYLPGVCIAGLFVLIRHKDNLARLATGAELKI